MYLDPEYLAYALQEGKVGDVELSHRSGGNLDLPSGALVACDPFVFSSDVEVFTLSLPPGSHPVVLSVARLKNGDHRVAFARIEVRAGEPVRWELMVTPGQDVSQLGTDEFFGYPVDAGTGCFGDKAAMEELARHMDADVDYWEKINDEMEKTYVHTWSWVNWPLPAGPNIVAFSSGYGDGMYPTFAGLDSSGDVVAVVTDFMVLPEPSSSASDQ